MHSPPSGEGQLEALTGGYHAAFLVGAVFAAGAAAIGGLLLRQAGAPAHRVLRRGVVDFG